MISRILKLLILSVFLASCGSNKGTIPVKLKILQSGITANSVALNGGILIVGRTEDGANSFRLGVPSSSTDLSLDLVKGKWEFAAIGWIGAGGAITGTNTCAYTDFVDLKDTAATVNFNFTKARCAQNFNGRAFSEHLNGSVTGEFLKLFPIPCYEPAGASMNTSICPAGANQSDLLSFKVIYESELKGNVTGAVAPLVSACFGVMGGNYPYLPMTSVGSDSPFGFTIQFFTDLNCTSVPVNYSFKGGALFNNLNIPHLFTPYGTYYTYLFINPGPVHDKRVPDSTQTLFEIVNALPENGTNYLNTPIANFQIINDHPASAVEMCLTDTVCNPVDWRPLAMSGTITLNATPGNKLIKLYHRNAFGDLSTNYSSSTVMLIGPMSGLGTTTSTSANVLNLYWTNGVVYGEIIASMQLKICESSSCSIQYANFMTPPNIMTGMLQVNSANLMQSMPIGTYYAKLEVTDIFGVKYYIYWPSFVTTEVITKS